jgi:hypothetical protein
VEPSFSGKEAASFLLQANWDTSSPSNKEKQARITGYKETKAGFAVFKWGAMELTTFDKELWPHLKANQGNPAELTFLTKQKGDKTYHNLDKILSLDGRPFDMEAKNFVRTKDGLV